MLIRSLNIAVRSFASSVLSRRSIRSLTSSWSWCRSLRIPSGIPSSSFSIGAFPFLTRAWAGEENNTRTRIGVSGIPAFRCCRKLGSARPERLAVEQAGDLPGQLRPLLGKPVRVPVEHRRAGIGDAAGAVIRLGQLGDDLAADPQIVDRAELVLQPLHRLQERAGRRL